MKQEFEVRMLADVVQVQQSESDEKQIHLQGYALKFGQQSENLGGFIEIINKNALNNCDLSNVYLTINHDENLIMARNTKAEGPGSLILKIDEVGLFFDAIPTNTSYFRDLMANLNAGILGKMSFRFNLNWDNVNCESWDWTLETPIRALNDIAQIRDVSVVTIPAYSNTEVISYQRALDVRNSESELENEKEKIMLQIELL